MYPIAIAANDPLTIAGPVLPVYGSLFQECGHLLFSHVFVKPIASSSSVAAKFAKNLVPATNKDLDLLRIDEHLLALGAYYRCPSIRRRFSFKKCSGVFELAVWGEQVASANKITVDLGYASVKIYDTTLGTTPTQILTDVSLVPLTISYHAVILEIQ